MLAAMEAEERESQLFQSAEGAVYNTNVDMQGKEKAYLGPVHHISQDSAGLEAATAALLLDQAQDSDLTDLAKNGLPSACIFVAKYGHPTVSDLPMLMLYEQSCC